MLHDQVLVLDLDIGPVVFGIQDGWIISSLLVVVDHPVFVELGSQGVVEHRVHVDRVVAEVFVEAVGVNSVMIFYQPTTWAFSAKGTLDKGNKCKGAYAE